MTDILHFMRLTIQATTPLSLGSGKVVMIPRTTKDVPPKQEEIRSAAIMRDANGLPVIPGPSMRGVLRGLYASVHGTDAAKAMFGFAKGDDVKTGRVVTGFGYVHNSHNKAVDGLVFGGIDDAVLIFLRADMPLRRDHVGLNGRHVTDGRKKFARAAAPIGTRFSFEFSMWADRQKGKDTLVEIARLFRHPLFRLGGSTRRGYGEIELKSATYAKPDLNDPKKLRNMRDKPPSVSLTENLRETCKIEEPLHKLVTVKGTLMPLQPWRIGGESKSMTIDTYGIRKSDGTTMLFPGAPGAGKGENKTENTLTIVREAVIEWAGPKGTLIEPGPTGPFSFPVPGSAIKGPLAHRALYHWNRGKPGGAGMIDADADEWVKLSPDERAKKLKELENRPAELGELLGEAKKPRDAKAGRAARVVFPDLAVTGVTHVMAIDHNSIDRFTGGVRNKALFAEEVLVGGAISFEMLLLPPPGQAGGWPEDVAKAFLRALADLCKGRLAIGARSLGFCKGELSFAGEGQEEWKSRFEQVQNEPA